MRYNTPGAGDVWISRSGEVIDEGVEFKMRLGGFAGVQLYDAEFYFGGDVSALEVSAYRFERGIESPLFSGSPGIRYDSTTNVSTIYGRVIAEPIDAGNNQLYVQVVVEELPFIISLMP